MRLSEGDIVTAYWDSQHAGEYIISHALVLHVAVDTGDMTSIMDGCGNIHYVNQGASAFTGFVIHSKDKVNHE